VAPPPPMVQPGPGPVGGYNCGNGCNTGYNGDSCERGGFFSRCKGLCSGLFRRNECDTGCGQTWGGHNYNCAPAPAPVPAPAPAANCCGSVQHSCFSGGGGHRLFSRGDDCGGGGHPLCGRRDDCGGGHSWGHHNDCGGCDNGGGGGFFAKCKGLCSGLFRRNDCCDTGSGGDNGY